MSIVFGQKIPLITLQKSLKKNTLHHTLLFYGEDGVDPMKSYHGRPVDLDTIIDEVLSKEV